MNIKCWIIIFICCYNSITCLGQKNKIEPDSNWNYTYLLDTSDESYANNTFLKGLLIDSSHFYRDLVFTNSTFNNILKFHTSEFDGQVDCSDATFNNKVIFRDLTFNGDVSFDNAVFSNYASFSDLIFGDNVEMTFNRAKLPDTIIFDYNSQIPKIDFSIANFNGESTKHSISLFKSDISKLSLDYIHFKLIWINYANAQLIAEDKETVYEALLANFKFNGQSESYKQLDIEYNDFKWDSRHLRLLGWISSIWWNYGYNKEFIFFWTFGFIIIFTITSFPWLNYLNSKVYHIDNIPFLPPILFSKSSKKWNIKDENIKKRWIKIYKTEPVKPSIRTIKTRFWYSFFYTSSIFFRLTLKVEGMKFQERKGIVYLMLVYLTGIVCLAYLANFVLQH
ncbi:MAG: pentapeptide repeat-containing protein [Ferruginibacter sp.]